MGSKYGDLKNKIKAEYQTTGISQRGSAKKYSISPSTIATWCTKENWLKDV